MIYQLVLITNLGMINPLVNFNTWEDCLKERAKITKTQQYSAECLPAQSPDQIQKQIESNMKMMMESINRIQKEK